MPHDDQDARQLDNSSGICVIFNEPEKDEQLSPEWNLLVRSMWRFKPKGRRVMHSLLGFLLLTGMPLYAGNAAQEKLEAKFLNRAVFIRGFYSNDDLTFDAQGKALRSPTSGPWSLALFEVQKLKIDKNRIRFEGFRAASVFDPETRKFKSVPLKKLERIRLTIAADTTSVSPDSLDDLANHVLTSRLTAEDVPEYWRDFFDGKTQHFRPGGEQFGVIPGERFEGDPVYRSGIGLGFTPPKLKSKSEPDYSEQARSSRIQGTTVIKLILDKSGVPHNLQVTRAIGFGLDDRAIEAAREWRFEPAMLKGTPVPVEIWVEVEFRLF